MYTQIYTTISGCTVTHSLIPLCVCCVTPLLTSLDCIGMEVKVSGREGKVQGKEGIEEKVQGKEVR